MKAPYLSLMLAALPALGGPQETLAPISLYTEFQQPPSPAVFNALRYEVNSIMAPAGLRFSWYSLPAAKGAAGSIELAVITFQGKCDLAGPISYSFSPGPLGWTHITNGVILPFAEVDCQEIRGFIQKKLLIMPAEDRERAYGRAVGRVLAHELYHIFANTTRHSSGGVGKSKYTVGELLAPRFQLEARECLALKTSKAHAALEAAVF